jgi:RNA polymerase sigma factor (sigma-70 family)
MNDVIQNLYKTVLLSDGAGLTDGQLLGCFVEHRDETAFAALVRRHAAMVWGVCRRLLGPQDADDAFQAAFLVLVRKAGSIVPRERVANWLYGVAYQTALQARRNTARRRGREKQVTAMPEAPAAEQGPWTDLKPLLDQELSRLPDAYREAIVLCDLEGKTRREVARQLCVPEGTVASRLARARTMLTKRLTRHGLIITGGTLGTVLSRSVCRAGAPNSLVYATIKAATIVAAGQAASMISVKVAALTEGVLKTMFLMKLKTVTAVVFVLVALSGAAGLMYRTQAAEQGQTQLPKHRSTAERSRGEKVANADAENVEARLRRLEKEMDRLHKENEELKKQVQRQDGEAKDLDRKLAIKVYSVFDLAGPPEPEQKEATTLLRAITKTIDPPSWDEAGGQGSIEYVQAAGSIIVRQTAENHKQVQDLLEALRKNRTELEKANGAKGRAS